MDELQLILRQQREILFKLDVLIDLNTVVLDMEDRMSQEIDDLTKAVENETTVEASAVTLIQGLAAQIASAKNDPAAVEALAAKISASSNTLAAAIAANTPAVPAPVPAPAVPPTTPPTP